MSVTIEVDTVLRCAYIRLSNEDVVRTIEVNDCVQVDLDRFGVAVGIEVLDDHAPLPFEQLTKFHVRSEAIELLRLIRPDVGTFITFTSGHDGFSDIHGGTSLTLV
ncbi:MAG: DUF2283 domain-containing protein [Actinomycetes bacterium]